MTTLKSVLVFDQKGKQLPTTGPIIGVDPGSLFTGYGVVEEVHGNIRALAFGVIEAQQSDDHSRRLLSIGQGLKEIFNKYKPGAVAIEKTFFAKNADSSVKLGQARGVCLYEAAQASVKVFEYSATEIKKGLTGSGRAEKDQVQMMVRALLGLPALGRHDMSDALALAIHHARVAQTGKKMSESLI